MTGVVELLGVTTNEVEIVWPGAADAPIWVKLNPQNNILFAATDP